MNDRVKVFFLEPTDMERRWLRRFSFRERCGSDGEAYCDAKTFLYDCHKDNLWGSEYGPAHSKWPTHCEKCKREFEFDDERQLFNRAIYKRQDTGELLTLMDAPPGACWNAEWMTAHRYNQGKQGSGYDTGPDGRCLVVRLPDGHDWMIDSRCNNCTLPDDNEHFCWVRHGRPEDGNLHVDKNGNTCSAGAGSILTPKWHGFLREGYLVI